MRHNSIVSTAIKVRTTSVLSPEYGGQDES